MSSFINRLKTGALAALFTVAAGGGVYSILTMPEARAATQGENENRALAVLQQQDYKNPVFVSSASPDAHQSDVHLRFKAVDKSGAARIVDVDVNGYVLDTKPATPHLQGKIIGVSTP